MSVLSHDAYRVALSSVPSQHQFTLPGHGGMARLS